MRQAVNARVTIFGTEFTFRTDDPEYIKELAGFVDEQIQKVVATGKITSQTKAIILAAFNVADELFRLQKEKTESSKMLTERLDAMLEMAENAYRPDKSSGPR